MPKRVGWISALQLRDGTKSIEQFAAFRRLRFTVKRRSEFLDHVRVYASVLRDIPRMEVKAKCAQLAQQGLNVGRGQTFSPIGLQTVLYEHEITLELRRVTVSL